MTPTHDAEPKPPRPGMPRLHRISMLNDKAVAVEVRFSDGEPWKRYEPVPGGRYVEAPWPEGTIVQIREVEA